MDVKAILRLKGSAVYSVAPDSPISKAVELMHEKRIGAVLVMSEDDGKIEGILSERDIIGMVAEHTCTSLQGVVKDAMTEDVVACTADCTLDRVITGMTKSKVRHLPVFQGDQLIGMVRARDMMQYRIRQLESGGERRFQRWFPKGKVYTLGG